MNRRKTNIDFLRIICSVMVVLLHTSAMGTLIPGEKGFLINTVLNSLTRFSVPVFIMISGYFMLGKEEDFSYFLKRSIKLIVIMILWSVIYLVKYTLSGAVLVNSVKDIVKYLLTQPIHLWYFYALSALILFTPALSVFARKSDKKTYIYTMTLMLVFGSVITMLVRENSFPTLTLITEKLKIGTMLTFPAFYLFGYFVKRFGISKKISLTSFVTGLILTVSSVIILSFQKGILSENVLSFYALNVAFMSMGIFAFFSSLNIGENGFIKWLAPLTGGIYGLHMIILPSVYEKLSVLTVDFIKIILSVLITYTICAIIVFVYRLIEKMIIKKGC